MTLGNVPPLLSLPSFSLADSRSLSEAPPLARKFSDDIQCTICIGNIEANKEMYIRCSSLFSTLSDWIARFEFLELNFGNRTSGESKSVPESTRNPTNKKTLHELKTIDA